MGYKIGLRLSSRFARIIAAVAYAGERLPINALHPLTNATYDLEAFMPLVRCDIGSSGARHFLHARASNESLEKVMSGAYKDAATVSPDFSYEAQPTKLDYTRHGVFGYIAAFNEPKDGSTAELFAGITRPNMTFMSCKAWNASVSYTAQSVPGSATQLSVTRVETKFINEMYEGCPRIAGGSINAACETYPHFFRELANYVTGVLVTTSMYGMDVDITDGNVVNTLLAQGSQWKEMVRNVSVYRQEAALSSRFRNTTFAQDIEELALNASLSTMSDPSLWYGP